MRSSSGNDQRASSSLVGTFFISYDLYAMAIQRRLTAAISSITFLKKFICKPGKLHLEELYQNQAKTIYLLNAIQKAHIISENS